MIKDFEVWLGGQRSKATVSSYHWALKVFDEYLKKNSLELLDCTLNDLSRYCLWLENKGLKDSTRCIYLTAVRTLWTWLDRQGLVKFRADLIPMPSREDTKSYEFLRHEDFNRLVNSLDDFFPKDLRNKTIIHLLYYTGVRLGELLSLEVADIDLDLRKARVKTFKRKRHYREIYWDEETNNILTKWLQARGRVLDREEKQSSALFISLDTKDMGVRIGRHVVQKLFRERRRVLGIERQITPHSCRHGFGARGVKNNINPRYLQIMMGHAKLSTTQIYMQVETKDVEQEYRKIYGR